MRRTHKRKSRARRRMIQNRFSVILVSCVIVILAGVLSVGSLSLRAKWQEQEMQLEVLNKQLAAEKEREEEINEFCQDLPRYKRPKKIIFEKVPRNPTGKIEKPVLRKKYCQGSLVEAQIK